MTTVQTCSVCMEKVEKLSEIFTHVLHAQTIW